jgi:PAS domain S-box-containing protein
MWDLFIEWFGSRAWIPHGHCFLWTPSLLWTLVGSNILIALAYYSIPVTLLTLVRRRSDLVHKRVFVLFAIFIFGCGTTHLVKVMTIWLPVYWLQGGVDVLTAGASVLTALLLWPLLPHILTLPSPTQLRTTNLALEGEIAERKSIEADLRQTRDELEYRVEKRTAELSALNVQLQRMLEEHRQTEEKLRQSEERYRHLANAMPQLVWTANPDGAVDYYNERSQEFHGITPSDQQWEWSPVLYPDDLAPTVAAWEASVQSGVPYEIEHRVYRTDGELRWYLSRAVPSRNKEGQITKWYGTATDIHARKRAEEEREQLVVELAHEVQIRQQAEAQLLELNENLEELIHERTQQVISLSSALSLAEQRERQRIAGILHDQLQQVLYAILFRIKLFELQTSTPPKELRAEFRSLIEDAIRITRTLTVDLSPPILAGEGLVEAIHWLAEQIEEMYHLKIHVKATESLPEVQEEMRGLLFQQVREVLFNVIKHAGVSEAEVGIDYQDKQVIVSVKDQGRGFDAGRLKENRDTTTGWGLFSIRERLNLFGGRMEILSAPGDGTTVTLMLPSQLNYQEVGISQ